MNVQNTHQSVIILCVSGVRVSPKHYLCMPGMTITTECVHFSMGMMMRGYHTDQYYVYTVTIHKGSLTAKE